MMTPEQWERISHIFEEALSLHGAEREAYLNEACAADPGFRGEVDSLLASHEQAGSKFLNTSGSPPERPSSTSPRAAVQAGHRIGPYLVEKQIGHGGMGEVYAATRADGQYEKKVALKLVRAGYDAAFVLERFRSERQILAGLEHPNIAGLLDGGTTEDTTPYLVMELVEGVPIDSYCDELKLSITERLPLFRQICSAVQYAHQRLVIHRDIKPGNILVTKDGTPKLLDFGIAKMLDASGNAEATMLRPMTPEYASPEQVRGEPVSTSTDVYSLGVVLYQLLTGRSPYRVDTRTPAKLAEAITHEEPEKPSTSVERMETIGVNGGSRKITPELVSGTREATPARLQKRLRGDLDFISMKALRKEPEHRYSSAEQLSEDIRRHLEGLPVTARKGTWNYKAGKFLKRHKVGVAAFALLLLAIGTGVAATLREARIAQRRFNDVRTLANSLMFELHDSIENIPGATQARKLVLQRSLEYLDKLSQDAGNDPDLLRELATAYRRIGMAQGNPRDPNLGDTKGALASFEKSLQMREALARSNPKNSKDQVQLAIAYLDYSDFQAGTAGNVAAGFEYSKKGLAILQREAPANPNNVLILTQSLRGYSNLAMMEVGEGSAGRVGTTSDAILDLQRGVGIAEQVIPLSPKDMSLVGQEAVLNGLLGEAYLSLGDRTRAVTYYRNAMDTLNGIAKEQNNVRAVSNVAVLEGKIGNALLMDGKTAEAIPYFTKAHETSAQLASRDPANAFVRQIKIDGLAELGFALSESGRVAEGIRFLRDALAESESEPTQTPVTKTDQGIFHTWLGQAFEHQGTIREASQEYLAGKNLLAAVRAAGSSDVDTQISFCSATNRLAASLLTLGENEKARGELDQSVAVLESLQRTDSSDQQLLYALAETYAVEGAVSTKLAESFRDQINKLDHLQAARGWFQKSLDVWAKVSNPTRLTPGGIEVTPPDEVSRRLATCNAQLSSLVSSRVPASPTTN